VLNESQERGLLVEVTIRSNSRLKEDLSVSKPLLSGAVVLLLLAIVVHTLEGNENDDDKANNCHKNCRHVVLS